MADRVQTYELRRSWEPAALKMSAYRGRPEVMMHGENDANNPNRSLFNRECRH
jgi:hypothetical protein